jgi:hypothetical protein
MSTFERPDTPAQTYAGLTGVFLLGLGILALVFTPAGFDAVDITADEPEFLVWSVNGWTAVFWIALGALGLLSAPRLASARMYALSAGLLFAAAAMWGFLDGENVAGVLVASTANNLTHAILAALGLLFGMLPLDAQRAPGDVASERRFDREMPTDRVPTGRR